MTPTDLRVSKEVQDKFTPDEVELKHLAHQLWESTNTMKGSYLCLCKYIREKQLTPKSVSLACAAGGMSKERISEVKRICFSSDKIFNSYVKGDLSFKAALASCRSGVEVTARVKWDRILSSFDRLVNNGETLQPFIHVHESHALVGIDLRLLADGKKTFSFKKFEVTVKEKQKEK